MLERLIFTTDPEYFPKSKVREIVSGLHAKNQRYSMFHSRGQSSTNNNNVVMVVDPEVRVRPGISGAYDRGSAAGIWKDPNGSDQLGCESYFSSSILLRNLTFCMAWSHCFSRLVPSIRSGILEQRIPNIFQSEGWN